MVQGFQAAKEGRRPQAYELFCEVVKLDPNNEHGWLYRAATTDDMAEAYVCLQRVLTLNPNNQKAQRGVERIRARMTGEENEAAQPPDHNVEAAAAHPSPSEQDKPSQTEDYNPQVNDNSIVSGMGAVGSGFQPLEAASSQFNDPQKQPESTDYAEASGYPYPTQETSPSSYTPNSGYAPVEAATYAVPEPQIQPEYEQNRYYQPTPVEETRSHTYQPVEEYRYQPDSYQAIPTPQPPEKQPDSYAASYQTDAYPKNEEAAQEYPDFMTTPVDDNGPIDNPPTKQSSRRENFRIAGAGASAGTGATRIKADKPKRSRGFGRKEEAPLIATFGTEQPTDLDEVGKSRSEKLQRRAAVILLILALLVFLIAGIVYLQHNSNNNDQQAANVTAEVVPPPSTPGGDTLTADATNQAGSNTTVNSTTNNGAVTGTNDTNGPTGVAVGTPAPVNPTTNSTNVGGNTGSNTTTIISSNPTTQATDSATTASASQTPAPQTTNAPSTTTAPTTSAAVATSTNAATPNNALKPIIYTVVSGDNLTNIAKKFGTTIPAVVAANKGYYTLNSNGSNLYAGNKIIIPVSRATFAGKGGVITKAGDTIASIATQNNVKPEDLLKFNGLASESDFKPGDALLIP